jgi:hypothetical protein
MMKVNWSEQLNGLFHQIDMVKKDAKNSLRSIYAANGLSWDDQIMKCLSGDIHSKALGAYLGRVLTENGVKSDMLYEVSLPPTMLRADILISQKITVESKAQGIFSLGSLKERWLKLNQKRPDLIHVLVSWHHNPSYVRQIREFMPESRHYYFHNLSTGTNQPQELERLVRNITNWLKEST